MRFIVWSKILLLAFLLCFLTRGVKADGCYTPKRDIGDEAGLAADICSINDALARSPPDYVTARAFYTLGYKSRNVTLQEIATGKALDSREANTSADLFGSEDWMDRKLDDAFIGLDVFTNDTKRVQFIKKLLQGSVLSHRMFTNFKFAYDSAVEGDRRTALEHLEKAMADFFGLESECAIFGNGQARGVEFDTMDEGVSAANYDIVESFASAAKAIEAEKIDLESLKDAFDEIRKNFLVIYLQAASKYATLIVDGIDPEKAQAEGFGYYHSIAGQIHAQNETAHEAIYDAFDIEKEPSAEKANMALSVIPGLLKDFEIPDVVFGTFDPENDEKYEEPEKIECEAVNPFADFDVEFVDNDR